ncbi:MAG TPA: acyl-CoA dehydrogenase family protein [Solirubrobacteraceae bacterium]|nr:acyl-CoA dehydrogenase family protein [Solirubrobacteraceae bacterium]
MSDVLDLHLSAEQRELYETSRTVAAGPLRELADAGTPGVVNRRLIRGLADSGLLSRLFADDQLQAMDLCLIREALARGCTEAETAFALQGLGAYPILQAGSSAVIERWIPAVASGDAVAAFALTEPEAGSDVAALSLRADPDPERGGHRLTGRKLWISNAPEADIYTVFARAPEGITAFAVPGDASGLTGEARQMLAPHAIGSLEFDEVLVPDDHRLGAPGEGFKVAMRTLDLFRPSVGAFAVGMARAALDLAVEHAGRRQAFGRPLSANQAVSHRLAELTARTHAARLLVHQAAAAHDAGRPDRALAAMAKLLATETAQAAVDAAVQVHGASGLEVGHALEHLYRDVRAPRIYEGASEIQREIIARSLFGR